MTNWPTKPQREAKKDPDQEQGRVGDTIITGMWANKPVVHMTLLAGLSTYSQSMRADEAVAIGKELIRLGKKAKAKSRAQWKKRLGK